MSNIKAVVGVFEYVDDAMHAVELAHKQKLEYRVYSPVPHHGLMELTFPKKSNIRVLTLIGALMGLAFGFFLPIWCSLDWPLRVSAKDVVSVPAFVVIGYECTILFGAIFTLLALFHSCRLPDVLRKVGYDERFSGDRFGVVISCESKEADSLKRGLLEQGAEEVQVRDGL